MPIKAENKHRYPRNWREIRAEILERAGHRCEQCGARNHQPHPITGSHVVLTIAHVHDPDPANLLALCQKCHARATRRAKKAGGDFFTAHG